MSLQVNDRVLYIPDGVCGYVVDVDLADAMVKVVYDCNPDWCGSWWFAEDFRRLEDN